MIQLGYTTSDFAKRRYRAIAVTSAAMVCVTACLAPTVVERSRAYLAEHRRQTRIRAEVTLCFDDAIAAIEQHAATGTPNGLRSAYIALDTAKLARSSNPSLMGGKRLADWGAKITAKEVALAAAYSRAHELGLIESSIQTRCEFPAFGLEALGFRLLQEGRLREAIGVFDQLVILDSKHIRARVFLLALRLAELLMPTDLRMP